MIKLELRTRDIIWLTSDLLSELVVIARTKGGCIIEVEDEEQIRSPAAYIFLEGDIDFMRHTKRCHTITLSNRIDVEQFRRAVKPEMDFGEIPHDQIYHFLIFHEIGHALLDPNTKIRRNADGTVNEDETNMVKLACELRADRYAWKSLFPSQPLPRRTGCESTIVRSLEAFMEDHKDLFTESRVPKPLPG